MNDLAILGCGAAAGLGAWVLLAGLRGRTMVPRARRGAAVGMEASMTALRRGSVAAAAGVLIFAVTGWLSAGALTAAGIALFAGRFGKGKGLRSISERGDAIAGWIEMLYAILAAGGGIERAISGSAAAAPAPIRREVQELAARLEVRPLPEALLSFAAAVAHPGIDKVVASLILASVQGAQDLVSLLRSQAEVVRAESRLVIEADAGRARYRTSARLIVGTTAVMAGGLYLVDRGYLAPYDSAGGQVVLAGIGMVFLGGFWLLARLGRVRPPVRYFDPTSAGLARLA
ncbi:MAG: hypothetical protein OXG47_02045 [bacterium]|nr:hypothetical protein [bacterium]